MVSVIFVSLPVHVIWKKEKSNTRKLKNNSELQAPVVQTSDSAIHRINHCPADSVIDFRNTYPLDSDLSGG